MGVDIQALRFLLRSRNTVSFENFLMLGRQWRHVSWGVLERELRRSNLELDIQPAIEKTGESRFFEPVLELLGARTVESLDFSDYEQATFAHDINEPIPDDLKDRFTCVYDGGTLEHVFDFPRAIRNAMEMVAVGGHFLGVGPANNYSGHGFYQFSPELYWRIFSETNGYAIEEVSVCEARRTAPCYRIKDPKELGRRVQFTNKRPTYVMVRARRLRQTEIFKTIPQQSYYEAAWTPQNGSSQVRHKDLRNWAKHSLPEPVKKILRPMVPQIRELSSSGFKKI
jgi:hypothetical protein